MTKVQLKTPVTINDEQFDSVTVFVSHKEEELEINNKVSHRHTVVEIKAGEHVITSGTAHCYVPDNFCRSQGRRRALATCFRRDTQLVTENRRAIFDAICPEFSMTRPTDRELLKIATAALQEIQAGEQQLGPARAAEALKKLGVVAVTKNPIVKPLRATEALARARANL